MKITEDLLTKYTSYRSHGYALFAATLSSYVRSRWFAMEHMPSMWESHFIPRVLRELPLRARKIDYDFFIECSDDGYWHLHGLFAIPRDGAQRIWNGGGLCKRLVRALASFRSLGARRPFRVNSFLIEPITDICKWVNYSAKAIRRGEP
jgi:hypothetical protein